MRYNITFILVAMLSLMAILCNANVAEDLITDTISIDGGGPANGLYANTFTTELEARSFIASRDISNKPRAFFYLASNADPDTIVLRSSFGLPENKIMQFPVLPGHFAVLGGMEIGSSRRIEAYRGCNKDGNDCQPYLGITNQFEFTDGDSRTNEEASINLSMVDGYSIPMRVSFPGAKNDQKEPCRNRTAYVPTSKLMDVCPKESQLQHQQGPNTYHACMSTCRAKQTAGEFSDHLCCVGEYQRGTCQPSNQHLLPWAADAYLWPLDDLHGMGNCRIEREIRIELGGGTMEGPEEFPALTPADQGTVAPVTTPEVITPVPIFSCASALTTSSIPVLTSTSIATPDQTAASTITPTVTSILETTSVLPTPTTLVAEPGTNSSRVLPTEVLPLKSGAGLGRPVSVFLCAVGAVGAVIVFLTLA